MPPICLIAQHTTQAVYNRLDRLMAQHWIKAFVFYKSFNFQRIPYIISACVYVCVCIKLKRIIVAHRLINQIHNYVLKNLDSLYVRWLFWLSGIQFRQQSELIYASWVFRIVSSRSTPETLQPGYARLIQYRYGAWHAILAFLSLI